MQEHYLKLLGDTRLQAGEADIGEYSLETKEITGWRFPTAYVQLSVEAENNTIWWCEYVFVEISNPHNRAFFFDNWQSA